MRKISIFLFILTLLACLTACESDNLSSSQVITEKSYASAESSQSALQTENHSENSSSEVSERISNTKNTTSDIQSNSTSSVVPSLPNKEIVTDIESKVLNESETASDESDILVYDDKGFAYTYDSYGNPLIVYRQINNKLDSYTVYRYEDPEIGLVSGIEVYYADNTIKSKSTYKNKKLVLNIDYLNGKPNITKEYLHDKNGNQLLYKITDKDNNIIEMFENEYDKYNNPTKNIYTCQDTSKCYTEVFLYDDNGDFLDYHKYDINGQEVYW